MQIKRGSRENKTLENEIAMMAEWKIYGGVDSTLCFFASE
jgi:hypothetical protein